MYIVAWMDFVRAVGGNVTLEDRYEVFETKADASDRYAVLLQLDSTHSLSLAGVVRSTDYPAARLEVTSDQA